MALNSLFCADVPLSNYSLTHSRVPSSVGIPLLVVHVGASNSHFLKKTAVHKILEVFAALVWFGVVVRVPVLVAWYPPSKSRSKTAWSAPTQSATLCSVRVDMLPPVLCARHVLRNVCCVRSQSSREQRCAAYNSVLVDVAFGCIWVSLRVIVYLSVSVK